MDRLFKAIFVSAMLATAAVSTAFGSDRFALAVGQHGDLLIYGPKGDKVADLPIPSIAQPVVVDAQTSFQISYGRDANNLLTAIISPSSTNASDLHFNVLNKNVDADKQAVVTLTFSSGLSHVAVDPGYVGLVQVNSENVRRDSLASASSAPVGSSTLAPQTEAAPPRRTETTTVRTASTESSSSNIMPPAPRMNTDVQPRQPSTAPVTNVSVSAVSAATTPDSATTTQHLSGTSPANKIYWPEPVTAPDGSTPSCGPNEMKLVCVHGSVTVTLPNGTTESGSNGLVVPSGSTVSTDSNSSAAVFMGGVNSARLMPNANASVTQQVVGTERQTTVNLQKGAVFSRVGHRDGETQKYQVQTPEGVAAARGTQYATVYVNNVMYVFGKEGTIPIYHLGKFIQNMVANGSATIQIFVTSSTQSFGKDLGQRMLEITLTQAQPFNTYTNKAIRDFINGHLTTQDKKYLDGTDVNIVWTSGGGITNGVLFGSTGDETGGGGDNGGDNGNGGTPPDQGSGPPDNTDPVLSGAGLTQTPAMDPEQNQ